MTDTAEKVRVGMVVFPGFTALDLIGPFEVLNMAQRAEIDILWHRLEPVEAFGGLPMTPTATFNDYGTPEVLFVPGGPGPKMVNALEDQVLLESVSRLGADADFVTSVCTGALILGAAGLLNGKRAATHWLFMDQLPLFGAEPVYERVVEDGKVLSGGGVTAGIDFGLTLLARLFGDDVAKRTQLILEYNPAPPFDSGSPEKADKSVVDMIRAHAPGRQECAEIAARIGKEKLGIVQSPK